MTPRPIGARLLASALLVPLSGCAALHRGVMGHAGTVADSQWHLYLIVGAVLVFVAGPVLLLVPIIAWHYRLSNKRDAYRPKWTFSWILEGFIWIPPTGIVIGLGFVLWHYTHRLDPYRQLASEQPAINVQAVGLDWKWLFIYPDDRVAAVNQLAVPVGRPIHVSLTSATVMQSLLVPQLAGQIYAMAGMRTQLNFEADKPGIYQGANTQFNGAGFQNEKFDVLALSPADYQSWLRRMRASAHQLDDAAYKKLMARSSLRHPIFFAAVPSGLFRHILVQSREPKP